MAFLARCPGSIELPSGEFVRCARAKRVEVTAGGFILCHQQCPRCWQPFQAWIDQHGVPTTYPEDLSTPWLSAA